MSTVLNSTDLNYQIYIIDRILTYKEQLLVLNHNLWLMVLPFAFYSLTRNVIIYLCKLIAKRGTIRGLDHNYFLSPEAYSVSSSRKGMGTLSKKSTAAVLPFLGGHYLLQILLRADENF